MQGVGRKWISLIQSRVIAPHIGVQAEMDWRFTTAHSGGPENKEFSQGASASACGHPYCKESKVAQCHALYQLGSSGTWLGWWVGAWMVKIGRLWTSRSRQEDARA